MLNAPTPAPPQVHEEEPDIDGMFALLAEQAVQKAALDPEEEPDLDAMFAWMATEAARKA